MAESKPQPIIDLVIPALNAQATLPLVLDAIPRSLARDIYVVDCGSTDATSERAIRGGAKLLSQSERGYGAACQRGLRHLTSLEKPPEIVVFLDADYADDPADLPALLEPIRANNADLVIGSRALGRRQPGSIRLPERVGNHLAVSLIRVIYGQCYTDLGHFRAIRLPALVALGMNDTGDGWSVEMQVKAAKMGLRIAEVPVSYRHSGASRKKISQRMKGGAFASYRVLFTIFRHATAR